MKQRFYSSKEIRQMFGIDKNTVLRWLREGIIPGGFKLGGKYFVPRESVDRFLKTMTNIEDADGTKMAQG